MLQLKCVHITSNSALVDDINLLLYRAFLDRRG